MSNAHDEILRLAKARYQLAEEADSEQRKRETADLRFYAGDQWDDDVLRARNAQSAQNGLPPIPARPSLVINKVREPVRQVLNEERQSDLGIELVPADDFEELTGSGDDTEVELREGLLRRIQRSEEAQDARTWAFARAVQAGRGYYGVMTRYLPGKTWDQEVYVKRFYDQSSVRLDPAHEQPDGRDAEWGFIGRDMPWEEYKRTWPRAVDGRNRVSDLDASDFGTLCTDLPGWFRQNGELRYVRVVDYWYATYTKRELVQLADGTAAWKDEVPEGTPVTNTRNEPTRVIKWCQLDGVQVLDETDWAGPDIPIVKVLCEELQPYDDQRRVEGMVRSARDSQTGFNAMVSKWVETIGYAPIPPFQIAEGQVEGYEAWYQQANTRAFPYLPFKQVDSQGRPAGKPERTNIDTPIAAIAGSVQMFSEAIQSTTGVGDPRLGKVDPSTTSGRAIALLQQQSMHGTSHAMDNLKRSIRYEGQITNNLLFRIYGRPGRILRILNGSSEPEPARIAHPPQEGAAPIPPSANGRKAFTLTKDARFNVVAKVTKSYDSRREQGASMLSELIGQNPVLMTWFGDLFFKDSDIPSHAELAERAKVMLDQKIQQMMSAKDQQHPLPPEVQAHLQQAMGMIEQLTKELNAKNQLIETDGVKWQAQEKIKQVEADKDIRLQTMRDATAITVAKIAALAKGVTVDREAENEALALAHELQQTGFSHEHEQTMQQRDHAHEAALSLSQQETQQEHEQDMQQVDVSAAAEQQQAATETEPEA